MVYKSLRTWCTNHCEYGVQITASMVYTTRNLGSHGSDVASVERHSRGWTSCCEIYRAVCGNMEFAGDPSIWAHQLASCRRSRAHLEVFWRPLCPSTMRAPGVHRRARGDKAVHAWREALVIESFESCLGMNESGKRASQAKRASYLNHSVTVRLE